MIITHNKLLEKVLDLLSFNDEIKLVISSEVAGFMKRGFFLACWGNSTKDLVENLIFASVFSVGNFGNFSRVWDYFIAL